jgi:hypothetical protein
MAWLLIEKSQVRENRFRQNLEFSFVKERRVKAALLRLEIGWDISKLEGVQAAITMRMRKCGCESAELR